MTTEPATLTGERALESERAPIALIVRHCEIEAKIIPSSITLRACFEQAEIEFQALPTDIQAWWNDGGFSVKACLPASSVERALMEGRHSVSFCQFPVVPKLKPGDRVLTVDCVDSSLFVLGGEQLLEAIEAVDLSTDFIYRLFEVTEDSSEIPYAVPKRPAALVIDDYHLLEHLSLQVEVLNADAEAIWSWLIISLDKVLPVSKHLCSTTAKPQEDFERLFLESIGCTRGSADLSELRKLQAGDRIILIEYLGDGNPAEIESYQFSVFSIASRMPQSSVLDVFSDEISPEFAARIHAAEVLITLCNAYGTTTDIFNRWLLPQLQKLQEERPEVSKIEHDCRLVIADIEAAIAKLTSVRDRLAKFD